MDKNLTHLIMFKSKEDDYIIKMIIREPFSFQDKLWDCIIDNITTPVNTGILDSMQKVITHSLFFLKNDSITISVKQSILKSLLKIGL